MNVRNYDLSSGHPVMIIKDNYLALVTFEASILLYDIALDPSVGFKATLYFFLVITIEYPSIECRLPTA